MRGRSRLWCQTVPRHWTGYKSFVKPLVLPNVVIEVGFTPRIGYHGLRWQARDAHGVPRGPWVEMARGGEMEKRRLKTESAAQTMSASGVSKYLGRWASVIAHCCVAKYTDGSVRKPGWVTISTYGSEWTVVVKDPDAAAQLRVRAATLDDALQVANELLSSDDTLWEPDPYLSSPRKRKGK